MSHAGTKLQNQNFSVLAKIDFSARTRNKICLNACKTINNGILTYLSYTFRKINQ